MAEFASEYAIRKVVMQIAGEVIMLLTNDVIGKIHANIDKYTYEYGGLPNKIYYNGNRYPTYEFKNAFQNEIKITAAKVASEIFYNWQGMSFDPDTWLHGTKNEETGAIEDNRELLAQILNQDIQAGFMTKARKPYWDITIDELFNQGELSQMCEKYVVETCAKYGILAEPNIFNSIFSMGGNF
jgi:hypothetical protein